MLLQLSMQGPLVYLLLSCPLHSENAFPTSAHLGGDGVGKALKLLVYFFYFFFFPLLRRDNLHAHFALKVAGFGKGTKMTQGHVVLR